MRNKVIAALALLLGVIQILLILVSWIVSAAMPELAMRSLLGSEGIRWLFGTFTENMQTPLLVWGLLASIAWGALKGSGLWTYVRQGERGTYRQRFAFRLVLLELLVSAVIIGALTLPSHAVLLSVTGHLFPSSFSHSLIPLVCFLLCVISVSYGLMSGLMGSLADMFHALSVSLANLMPLWVLYVLGMELYASFRFVLSM
ncbi:MAG: AbgT family transporter [Prevotella sp.]|nr:AbgT family transporter [Prevotella sp.]